MQADTGFQMAAGDQFRHQRFSDLADFHLQAGGGQSDIGQYGQYRLAAPLFKPGVHQVVQHVAGIRGGAEVVPQGGANADDVINIVGGIIIGVAQQDLSMGDAAKSYTLLTVGDGLVTQIPALIVSTAAGMLVTKSGTTGSTDKALFAQLGRRSGDQDIGVLPRLIAQKLADDELDVGVLGVEAIAEVQRFDGSLAALRFVEIPRESVLAIRSFCRVSGLMSVVRPPSSSATPHAEPRSASPQVSTR